MKLIYNHVWSYAPGFDRLWELTWPLRWSSISQP